MAGAGRLSLRSSSARVLLLFAVFIMLSGYGAEGRQCYWCGPLAEQVHRSRRAPPCEGAARHITVCEPGYDHCAMVATSPPYLESRFCVKFYQDECYPLFCNSTKTWKMTCPCRGDLCNGDNTEREEDAFSALSRLLAKTHSRIKKRAPSTQLTGNRKGRIVNPEPDDEHLLAGNSVEEEKQPQDKIQQQNGSLTIDNQTIYKEQATETITGNMPTSRTTSISDRPIAIENEESENSTSKNEKGQSEHRTDIPTTIDGKSAPENGANIQESATGKETENTKTNSPVMIEIDIIQRPLTSTGTVPESNFQADEPMHSNDQSELVSKNIEEESYLEESKPNETTTTNLPKLDTTSRPPQTEMSVNSDEKIDINEKVKPFESTSTETVQIVESQTNKPVSEKQNEVSSTERLSTVAPTAHQVTGNTVAAKNKKKNNAMKVIINTLIIINCTLLSTFISYAF